MNPVVFKLAIELPGIPHRLPSFSRSLLISGALVVALVMAFAIYVWSEKQIDRANEQRLTSYLLADELRQSSDDLTRAVRVYIVTGHPGYKQKFQEILDIRSGVRPRPDSVLTAWHLMNSPESAHFAVGNKIALIDLMKLAGFTELELQKLQEAHLNSDVLTNIEFEAMRLVENAPAQDEASRDRARQLVFGEEYVKAKEAIMQPIDDFQRMIGKRTHDAVEMAEQRSDRLRMVFILLGVGLLAMLWRTYRHKLLILGAPLDDVYDLVARIGHGDFTNEITIAPAQEASVVGWLATAQAKLKVADEMQKRDQEQLRLGATIFHVSSEAIMVVDVTGVIQKVNEAFLEMSGYSRDEVIGQTPRLMRSDRHDADFYRAMWDDIKRNGDWRGEVWNRKKTGELYVGILSINAVKDETGAVQRYISLFTDITPLKQHQQHIERMAYHDTLTQLPNRALLGDRMQQALARAKRFQEAMAVVCLDLDGFKAVNDNYGHESGDSLLIQTAQRLNACVRTGDTVARLGGDEFVLLLCGLNSREDCERSLKRVLNELMIPYSLGEGQQGNISGSIGYTLYPDDDADPDTLLRHADHAMYAAKQAGKNRYHPFDLRQDNRANANRGALARIEKALDKGEFRLYIQPKVYLDSGKIAGGEALIRWIHPIRGLIPPSEFLPLIEEQDLALGVGEWVIEEGLRLLEGWSAQGLDFPLSVNIAARQLREPDFSQRLAGLLKRFPKVPPQRLEIEIVESTALDDMYKISTLIAECQALGVHFSLDDFGTGYSSLTYLKRLAVNTLKIDQSFVCNMLEDESDLAIVRGVIGLAQAFGSHTVAEGVETWQHAARLKEIGCEIAQGYAIARPMPAEELSQWIAEFRMPKL